jgi:hypothetical protein
MGMKLDPVIEAMLAGSTPLARDARTQMFRSIFDDAHAAWEQAYTAKLAGKISKAEYQQAWAARQNARRAWQQAREQ